MAKAWFNRSLRQGGQHREPMIDADRAHRENLRLSQLEYQQRHVYLYSRPRCLGLVLGNACNIDCLHCYQSKSGENLLHPPEIGEVDRKSTRLNSSHLVISYAVFCLKKKNTKTH